MIIIFAIALAVTGALLVRSAFRQHSDRAAHAQTRKLLYIERQSHHSTARRLDAQRATTVALGRLLVNTMEERDGAHRVMEHLLLPALQEPSQKQVAA